MLSVCASSFSDASPDIFHRFKFTQKGFPPGITDPRDIIQDRMDLFPAPEGTMVFNGKPMGFILDPGDQTEAFAGCVNRNLHIVEIQASRPMMIILDHTADRDAYPKLIQHLQSDIYLPLPPSIRIRSGSLAKLSNSPLLS